MECHEKTAVNLSGINAFAFQMKTAFSSDRTPFLVLILIFNVSSIDKFYPLNSDCGQAGSAWRGVQRASCPLQNNVNLDVLLDEEQATAVRPPKTQNDMRKKNLEKIGYRLEHENRADRRHRRTA